MIHPQGVDITSLKLPFVCHQPDATSSMLLDWFDVTYSSPLIHGYWFYANGLMLPVQ